jgi:predicted methyltransferase
MSLNRAFAAVKVSTNSLGLAKKAIAARPKPFRAYDQIPMLTEDLVRQVLVLAPYMANRRVGFIGDSDVTSLVLGICEALGVAQPAVMFVLDFDLRLLKNVRFFADTHGFGHRVHVRPYNAFDALPPDLIGSCDFFYTNPPFGSRNEGASARLFIERGLELVGPDSAGGCIITPRTWNRPWTELAWKTTRQYLQLAGWRISASVRDVHRYHLADDQSLKSATTIVQRAVATAVQLPLPVFASQPVRPLDITHFYGRSVEPPYPRYILEDGSLDFGWTSTELLAA